MSLYYLNDDKNWNDSGQMRIEEKRMGEGRSLSAIWK